jgi:hypothetical protein
MNQYKILGLVALIIIFVALCIVLLVKKENFNGLVPVENMFAVSELISEAKDKGCDNVVDSILDAQKDPYNKEKASLAVSECNKKCPGLSPIKLATLANIPGYVNNYMDISGCCNKVYLDSESCCGF